MAERVPEAVQLPDHHHVAFAQVGEHVLQDGALNAGPTDDLLIHLPAAGLPEGVELEGKALLLRAHPGVPDLHGVLQEFDILVVFTARNSNQFSKPRGCQTARRKSRRNDILQKPQKMGWQNGRFFGLLGGSETGPEMYAARQIAHI